MCSEGSHHGPGIELAWIYRQRKHIPVDDLTTLRYKCQELNHYVLDTLHIACLLLGAILCRYVPFIIHFLGAKVVVGVIIKINVPGIRMFIYGAGQVG